MPDVHQRGDRGSAHLNPSKLAAAQTQPMTTKRKSTRSVIVQSGRSVQGRSVTAEGAPGESVTSNGGASAEGGAGGSASAQGESATSGSVKIQTTQR